MTENEAIELHIAENLHRIEVIEEFLRTNSNADDKECKKNIQILTKIDGALQEIQQYREIGTVEECREMKERQEAKQPYIWGAWDDAIPDMYDCPNCGENYGIGVDDYDHCPKCGQAFDKSDLANQYK